MKKLKDYYRINHLTIFEENKMRILQTKGVIKDGEIQIELPPNLSNGEVDVILVAKNELDEFEKRHQIMIEKGYDTPEKIMELIKEIKLEMLAEKGRT